MKPDAAPLLSVFQIDRDFVKVGEDGLEVFDDLGGNDVGIGEGSTIS